MLPVDGRAPSTSVSSIRTGPRGAPTVLLLHAVGYDLTYWDRQIEALYRDHQVVAIDLPGHGRSLGTAQDWATFDQAVGEIANLVGALDQGPVHLVGISFGSMIAQELTLAHPHCVRSLTLIGSASRFAAPAQAAMHARAEAFRTGGMQAVLEPSLARWYTERTRAERPDLMDRVTKTILGDDPSVQAAIWTLIAGLDTHERLGRIACPTLLLVGALDTSTPPSASKAMAKVIAGARVVVLPDTAHLATVESPGLVNAELQRFLAGA